MAKKVLRPVSHDEQLSIVEHLDELRSRLIICLGAIGIVFGLCFWQNDRVLDIVNEPVKEAAAPSKTGNDPLERAAVFQQALREQLLANAIALRALAADEDIGAETRRSALVAAQQADLTAALTPPSDVKKPVTLGVGEPFFTTMKVAGYGGLLLALPLLLYQAYAFLLPAFSPTERRVALPLMLMVPFLFVAGVCFAYFLVLPSAVNFLQNFNDDNYDILLQAKDFYSFSILVLMAMGALFQIPVAILAVTRVGIVSVAQLRRHRRYAVVFIAVLAMLLPGQDPVTLVMAMAPLILLYEGSILLVTLLDRKTAKAHAQEAAEMSAANDAELVPLDPDDPPGPH